MSFLMRSRIDGSRMLFAIVQDYPLTAKVANIISDH